MFHSILGQIPLIANYSFDQTGLQVLKQKLKSCPQSQTKLLSYTTHCVQQYFTAFPMTHSKDILLHSNLPITVPQPSLEGHLDLVKFSVHAIRGLQSPDVAPLPEIHKGKLMIHFVNEEAKAQVGKLSQGHRPVKQSPNLPSELMCQNVYNP